MWIYLALALCAAIILVFSTQLFVSGASRVAEELDASPVLIGAVILGCGTGLPELALTFYGSHESPFRQLFHSGAPGGMGNLGLLALLLVFVAVFAAPSLFPDRFARHSPAIMAATIGFCALLRGSLDRPEALAMITGFIIGVGWIMHSEKREAYDPFAPLIEDKYDHHGAFVDGPVMSPAQTGFLASLFGLLGTAIGAQLMAYAANALLEKGNATALLRNLVFIGIASLLPHVVVAVQALRQHHEGLAVGNLIGSNLFNSLVIGGSMAIIRPYQPSSVFSLELLGIIAVTAVLTWMLLHTQEDEMSRISGITMVGAYSALVLLTVL